MKSKALIALTALALTLPVAAHAETIKQTTITKISKSNPDVAKASAAYQGSASQKAAASLKAHAEAGTVPPGYKVTTVKTGEIVTQSYRMPSAPVAGSTSYEVTNEVFVPATNKDEVVEWYNNQPVSPSRVTPSSGAAETGSRIIKQYND